MKRLLSLYIGLLFSVCFAWGLTIPAGTLYFDNTRTGYAQVQMVYGYNDSALSFVRNMSLDGEKWCITFEEPIDSLYRYTFSNTTMAEGTYRQTFSRMKDSISHTLNCYRTSTTDSYITAGYIYVPSSSDNWTAGSWKSLASWQSSSSGSLGPSGTLPIVYVNTENNQPVQDKVNYINASAYIETNGVAGYSPLGSAASPVLLQIRGRGNWTWNGFDKKPYRLKFGAKQTVLGMPSSKHWALMANADDNLGFLRNTVGFMVSQRLGMRWTPHQVPVELVLNGQYQGLYFLTEIIRVETNRVNIAKQEDGCTNLDSIQGGWLVEIDNYSEDGQVLVNEPNSGEQVKVTIHTPDSLSAVQRNYITTEINSLNDAIYESTSAHWEQLIDVDELAKFYLVQEILENTESFHGSCYFYKDMGAEAKWFFGPVWDFGNSYWRHAERFVYDGPSFPQHWIGQMAESSNFQTRVMLFWHDFLQNEYSGLKNDINAFTAQISAAAVNDADKWQSHSNVRTNRDMNSAKQSFLNNLNWRVNWLRSQWGNGLSALEPDLFKEEGNMSADGRMTTPTKLFRNGQIVIYRDGKYYSLTGILLSD